MERITRTLRSWALLSKSKWLSDLSMTCEVA
jgi:hypothetical protein